MAARDIMPWRSPQGGTTVVQPYSLLADEDFLEGEVVRLDTATGQLEEAADDPDIRKMLAEMRREEEGHQRLLERALARL